MNARIKRYRIALIALLLGTVSAMPAHAAKGDTSYSVLMSQDNFFGFYPSFNGLVGIDDDTDFSFYGILWTRDAFGTSDLSGDDLWTEFGVGINRRMLDGRLSVKPQLGILNGALLSGGETDSDGTGANIFDGVVPSLTMNYSDEKYEAEWYSGYYIATQGQNENDFIHLWLNGGYKLNQYASVGAHYELLDQTEGGAEQSIYQWLGPYVQFTLPQGFYARFSAGADIDGGGTGDFYKLNVGMSF